MTVTCVRPLLRADIPAVLAIEAQANPSPWRSADFEAFAAAPASPGPGASAGPCGSVPVDTDPGVPAPGLLPGTPGGERKAWVYADPEVRGFLCAMAVAGEVELQSIAVERLRWSRGAGSAMMASMVEWARSAGLEAIHLEVREGNSRALEFYARHGFAAVGRRPKYYQDNGEAAVLMKRAPV